MVKDSFSIILFYLLVFGVVSSCNSQELRKDFYNKSCPQAEKLVRDITWGKALSNPGLGAQLLRMHFHDCFVRGCDASILLDSVGTTQAEKEAVPNQALVGYDDIDDIKTQIEQVCPGIVSCADILTLAARDAVSFPFQKPMWDVLTGRRDGKISLASEVAENIPSPFDNFSTLAQAFANKGLNVKDLVVLSGAHTIGVAHCKAFSNRLYNFTGNNDTDPSLNPIYAEYLKAKCPNPANPEIVVEMDPLSSLSFDSHYFHILLQDEGLFQSDAALLTDTYSSDMVRHLQMQTAFLFEFSTSVEKMGAIEVLTGNAGEIRMNCHVINPTSQPQIDLYL